MKLNIKRIEKNGKKPPIPTYATNGSAGLDLTAFVEDSVTIIPNELVKIPTGICVEIPAKYVGLCIIRSSLGVKSGISLSNCVGVIDSDYRGEIILGLINNSCEKRTIIPGERIAQLVIVPYLSVEIEEKEVLSETVRGDGGFGSTGIK